MKISIFFNFQKNGTKTHSLVKSKFSSINIQDDYQMTKTELCLHNNELILFFKWIQAYDSVV